MENALNNELNNDLNKILFFLVLKLNIKSFW